MRFGDFSTLCSEVPSYTWCNLFYRQVSLIFNRTHLINIIDHHDQVLHNDGALLTGLSSNSTTAPVGVNPKCGIPLVQSDGSLGNIANIITCGLSVFVVVALIVFSSRRKAAVGAFSTLNLSLRKHSRVSLGVFVLGCIHLIATHMVYFHRTLRASHILWRIPSDTDIPNSDDWLRHSTRHPRPGHSHCCSCRLGCYSLLDPACQCHRSNTSCRRWHLKLPGSASPLVLNTFSIVNTVSNSLLASSVSSSLSRPHTYPWIPHSRSPVPSDLRIHRKHLIAYHCSC